MPRWVVKLSLVTTGMHLNQTFRCVKGEASLQDLFPPCDDFITWWPCHVSHQNTTMTWRLTWIRVWCSGMGNVPLCSDNMLKTRPSWNIKIWVKHWWLGTSISYFSIKHLILLLQWKICHLEISCCAKNVVSWEKNIVVQKTVLRNEMRTRYCWEKYHSAKDGIEKEDVIVQKM